jgi:hypothetical protein
VPACRRQGASAIRAIRDGLIAEHLGVDRAEVVAGSRQRLADRRSR